MTNEDLDIPENQDIDIVDEIKFSHTPCKDCIFAEYNKRGTQIECRMGLLEKYKQLDHIDIIEAFDEEKDFYIISGKKCAGYKDEKYFDARNLSDLTIEQKIEHVNKLLVLKYLAVIDCRTISPDQVYPIIDEIKKSNIKPSMITLVTAPDNGYKIPDYYIPLNRSGIGCRWKIKSTHAKTDLITIAHEIINLGAEQCNFVLTVAKDYSKIDKIISTANDIVYNKFNRFVLLANESRDVMLFNKAVYVSGLQTKHDIITHTEEHTVI